jgi:protease-4
MTIDYVKELADGRIYTAKQALSNGLIDKIGTYGDAISDMQQTYNLHDIAVEDFRPEISASLYSLLGIVADQNGNNVATDMDAIEELLELNGTFRVSYISNVNK